MLPDIRETGMARPANLPAVNCRVLWSLVLPREHLSNPSRPGGRPIPPGLFHSKAKAAASKNLRGWNFGRVPAYWAALSLISIREQSQSKRGNHPWPRHTGSPAITRFPTPQRAPNTPSLPVPLEQAFVVEDANGQAVAYTYFRHDPNEARQANVLTLDEARRIARTSPSCPAYSAIHRGTSSSRCRRTIPRRCSRGASETSWARSSAFGPLRMTGRTGLCPG